MANTEEKLRLQLDSSDHLVVCAALKALREAGPLSTQTVQRVVSLAAPGIQAVEINALDTLAQIGPSAAMYAPQLLKTLARQIDQGGCTFDCCGYGAFYVPVLSYIRAILALEKIETRDDLEARIFPQLEGQLNAELLKEVFDIRDFEAFR